jgi:hypothetical protein
MSITTLKDFQFSVSSGSLVLETDQLDVPALESLVNDVDAAVKNNIKNGIRRMLTFT